MEVVGVVAAIPGLIDIITRIKTTVQGLVNRKVLVKETTNLIDQLDLINQILADIRRRWSLTSCRRFRLDRLPPAINSLKDDLESLEVLLSTIAPIRKATLFLKQAMLMASGVEAKIKGHSERLEKTKSLLMLVIISHGEEIATESLSTSQSSFRLELSNLLRPCDHNFIPENLSGTCEWIWTYPSFSRWATAGPGEFTDRMMCIYGTKGCGKSVLAASIIKHLKFQGKVASLFSFLASRGSQRKLVDFLRTHLWHLLQHLPDEDLHLIYTPLMKSLPINEHNLGDAIKTAGRLIRSTIYCAIDAVDESSDNWSRPEDGSLKCIFDLVKTLPNYRLILLGREPAIRATMAITPSSIEITDDAVRHDMHNFIDVELDRSLKVQTPATRQLVRQSLQEKSTNMFLWVSLVFTELNRCYLESEIRQALERLPRDLDREYHRLFAQLMARLGGTSARPSIAMQRTKCLLSLIIAADEPLTCDELRHAFASCQPSDESYDKCLIDPRGITYSVGDFVRVWDGRYHTAHTSLTEFLTRDLELWEVEDEAVVFFRIDMIEAQTTMCLACLNYLIQADLGYPMTDDSPDDLPARLVFFRYSSSSVTYHLVESCLVQLDPLIESRLHVFLRSPQFWAFIEYLFLCVQHGEWVLTCDYTQFLEALVNSENLATLNNSLRELLNSGELFEPELYRRKIEFGPNHAKCQSWQSVMMAIEWIYKPHKISHPSRDEDIIDLHGSGYPSQEHVIHIARGPISDLPQYLSTNPLEGTNPFMNSIVRLCCPTNFSKLSAEFLPIPILCLWFLLVSETAERVCLLSIALKKLNGQRNFSEALFSCGLANHLRIEDDKADSIWPLFQKGLDIATKLPPLPHVEFLILCILYSQSAYLTSQGKYEESHQILLQLQRRLLERPVNNQRIVNTGYQAKRYLRLFHGKLWNGFKASMLSDMANHHYKNGDFKDACQVADLAIASLEKLRRRRGARLLALEIKANSQYAMGMLDAAEKTYRKMLHELDRSNKELQLRRRWNGLSTIAWCLFKQGKENDAKQWVQQIDLNLAIVETHESIEDTQLATSKTSTNVKSMARVSIYLGEFNIAEKLLNKAIAATNLSREIELQPYLSNLNDLAETLEEYRQSYKKRETILKCYQLLAALETADCAHSPAWWHKEALDIRCDCRNVTFNLWDVVCLKGIDVSVARFGVLSDPTFFMYMELVDRYSIDGEPEAAAAVLQDYISRHTSATREAANAGDQCYEFVFRAAPSASQRSGRHLTSSVLSYEIRIRS